MELYAPPPGDINLIPVRLHSELQGLTTGDDHTQYPLKAGTETISGAWTFSTVPTIAFPAPTLGSDAANKTYVDGKSSSTTSYSVNAGTSNTITTPKPVYMSPTTHFPISFDQASAASSSFTTNPSISSSFTVGAGSNQAVVIYLATYGGDDGSHTLTVDGVSQSLSFKTGAGGGTGTQVSVACILGLSAGSHTYVASATGGSCQLSVAISSYFGCKQTGQMDAHGGGATNDATVVTITNGSWVVGASGGQVRTYAGGGNTPRAHTGLQCNLAIADTNAAVTPAGSQLMSDNWTGGLTPFALAVSLVPVNSGFQGFDLASAAADSTSLGYIGFIAASSTANVAQLVTTGGTLAGFSGLTLGSVYYLGDTAGTIGTSAGTKTHKVGVALSATELNLLNSF